MSGPCCVDVGAKQTHIAQGHEETIGELNTYKTGDGKSVIVIFTDVFGYSFTNTRKIADTFAQATGSTVLIPDLFHGDPVNSTPPFADLISQLPAWLKKHPVDQACASSEKFISTIEEQYQSVQVIGFCYGGKPVVQLTSQPKFSSALKAGVVAHPSFLVKEEAAHINKPMLFLCAEKDDIFSPDLRKHFEKVLAPTNLATFIDFPGTTHGFVVRPDDSAEAHQMSDKAVQDAINFFKKNI